VLLEVLVQARQRLPHLDGGADRAERVVLVQLGQAEDRHHRVADELRYGAAVPLDDRPHALDVVRQDPVEGLGIQPLAEPVESTTSEKRIVTTLRKRSDGCCSRPWPQALQNRAPSGFSVPHDSHLSTGPTLCAGSAYVCGRLVGRALVQPRRSPPRLSVLDEVGEDRCAVGGRGRCDVLEQAAPLVVRQVRAHHRTPAPPRRGPA
jgi:hypothetical protein